MTGPLWREPRIPRAKSQESGEFPMSWSSPLLWSYHSLKRYRIQGLAFFPIAVILGRHKNNLPPWLSWPHFHNFTPSRATSCIAGPGAALMHFHATLLIMTTEIRFNFQIGVQCAEKAISDITFNIRWNLKQIWRSWYTWVQKGWYQRVREQWGLSGLISVIRSGLAAWPGLGDFFRVVILPKLTVWALGWFE